MRKATRTRIAVLLAGAFCLAGYQNCAGQSSQFENVALASQSTFFAYPYNSAPAYYVDLQLYTDASGNLTLFAAVSNPSDTTDGIAYQLQLTAADGSSIGCTAISATLPAGSSSAQLTCTPTSTPTHFQGTLTAGSGSAAVVISKTF